MNENKKQILDFQDLEYSEDQQKVLSSISDIIDGFSNGLITHKELKVSGFAGTGKTTIIKNILLYSKQEKAFKGINVLAPTNKAKNVLINKFKNTSGIAADTFNTLHSHLYGVPTNKEKETSNEPLKWTLKGECEKVIVIIDESSLIDEKTYNDIIKFFKKSFIIFMGDGFQLEPVGKDSKLLANPDLTLTQVRRNSGDILNYSVLLRTQNRIVPPSDFPDINHISFSDGYWKYIKYLKDNKDCIFIVVTNKRRVTLNKRIRADYLKTYDSIPVISDRLISIANSDSHSNGDTFTVEELKVLKTVHVKFTDPWKTVTHEVIVCKVNKTLCLLLPSIETSSFYHFSFSKLDYDVLYDLVGVDYITFDENERYHQLSKLVTICTYGYAISGHKSQGSQWENVVVWQDILSTYWSDVRWLYTAITRAEKELTIII